MKATLETVTGITINREQDAREYAKNAVFDYYWRIDEYLYSED